MATSRSYRYHEALESLHLVEDVNILKSYITWMEELAEHVEKSAFSKADSLESYIKLILEDVSRGKSAESNYLNEEKEVRVGYVAMKINVALMSIYVGDFASAMKELDFLEGESLESKLSNLTGARKEIIVLLWDSLVWTIGELKRLEEGGTSGLSAFQEKESFSQAEQLNRRWEAVVEGGAIKQMEATMVFLKGCLSAAMKVTEDIILPHWIEATKLDPECSVWFHYAYRNVRRIRRNTDRTSNWLPGPSAEEKRFARAAYYLSPDDIVTVTDYAVMLKDTLWMEKESVWEDQEHVYLKCVEIFKKALKLAKEVGSKGWSLKIMVYFAEFLTLGKGKELDQNVGKRMFDELALEFPDDSLVLHKVAKLYHHGLYKYGNYAGDCVDLDRAKGYYQRAFEVDPGNFACLMDHLKLLQRLHQYAQMITVVDKSLPMMKRDFQAAKLHCGKAYVTWIWNPMNESDPKSAAIDSWIYVLKNFPECAKDVYNSRSFYFDKDHKFANIQSEILEYLKTVKRTGDHEENELINTFIEKLSKPPIPEKRVSEVSRGNVRDSQGHEGLAENMKRLQISSSSRVNSQHPTHEASSWKTMRQSSSASYDEDRENRGYQRQWKRSEADEDDDWRRKD